MTSPTCIGFGGFKFKLQSLSLLWGMEPSDSFSELSHQSMMLRLVTNLANIFWLARTCSCGLVASVDMSVAGPLQALSLADSDQKTWWVIVWWLQHVATCLSCKCSYTSDFLFVPGKTYLI